MEQKNVLLISVKEDKNLGDFLLGDCLSRLLERQINDIRIKHVDLRGRKILKFSVLARVYYKGIRIIKHILGEEYDDFDRKYKHCISKYIKNTDAVIFAGGGIIEYKRYQSYRYIQMIVESARKYRKPVIFNSVGLLDHFNSSDSRAVSLRKCLCSDNVVYIGVRENEAWMREYVNDKKSIHFVCDPACLCSQIYNIKRKKESKIIGIGIIRPNIFKDYGLNISDEQISDIYYDVIKFIKSTDYSYQMFSNGSSNDLALVALLKKRYPELSDDPGINVIIPEDARSLVEIISNFKIVFASRMHASIISFSLGIPSISLCWADKIDAFYKRTGRMNCCFWPTIDQISSQIIESLRKALETEITFDNRNEFLNSAISAIKDYEQYI